MNEYGIDKACISSGLSIFYDFSAGNLELKREVEKFPGRFIPFCTVHPRYEEEAIEELRKCVKEWGWKAIKLHPQIGLYPINSISVYSLAHQAVELGFKAILTHSGSIDTGSLCRPHMVAELAKECPDITIIMGHMGIQEWFDAIEFAEEQDNIVLETSGSIGRYGQIETAVKTIGAERVIFGTDFPYNSIPMNLSKVRDADISEADKGLILGRNIARILVL